MQGSFRLAVVLLAWLGLGCATNVDVAFDEREDFSDYRTWRWLSGAARSVETPRGDARALEARLAALVEGALQARGFERSSGSADLLVVAYLGIQRQLVYANETGAVQHLPSLHFSPSYEVQATTQELQTYETGYLVIAVSDARRGVPIWRGEFSGRFRDDFGPHLDEAVSTLLERFPPD